MNTSAAIVFSLGLVISAFAILTRQAFSMGERALLAALAMAVMLSVVWWL